MADTHTVSALGLTVAMDEVTDATLGTCKVQYVKLMDGTLDGTSKAAVGSNGLYVDVRAFQAGQSYTVSITPNVTAGAYTANDLMGGLLTITNAARSSGGGGVLSGITMITQDDSNTWAANDVEVILFKAAPTGSYSDNNALDSTSIPDADATNIIASVLLDTKSDLGNLTLLQARQLDIAYVASGTSLYALVINRGGRTPDATNAVQFKFEMLRD